MTLKEQYEANKSARERRRENREQERLTALEAKALADREGAELPWHWAGQRDPVARYTLWLAVFTFALLVTSILQWLAVRGQLNEMKSSSLQTDHTIDVLKTQAGALERTSMAGRPYIFVDVNQFAETCEGAPPADILTGGQRVVVCVTLRLDNFGQSPAIITGIESHVYLAEFEPDPLSPGDKTIKENIGHPAQFGPLKRIGVSSGFETNDRNPAPEIVIAGKSASETATQSFVFFNLEAISQKPTNRFSWYWIIVHYTDIYGCERKTTHFSALSAGMGISHSERNTWDTEPCAKKADK